MVRPIGLREPKYSPFGPGRIDREWTGVCAPAVDPKVRSVEGKEEPELEVKRRKMRDNVIGDPLTAAERKILADKCQRQRDNRQVNLGTYFGFPVFFYFFDVFGCFGLFDDSGVFDFLLIK